ncbi:sulfite reductase subunit beta [Cantharellus anzutake]|uniref:sulfite reductase subunit beta n=1 Tax=Cantharellus anzutake TaxID=1750568 RepID=UPI001907CE5C|nr:sulfite reductase subunit beta [Cantharellus anzutake]KAF8327148.1 sulfite reductase subunit beta [Cantharellus anzutake]
MSASEAVAWTAVLSSSLVVDVLTGDVTSSVFTPEYAKLEPSTHARIEAIAPGGDFLRPLKTRKGFEASLISLTISSLSPNTLSRLLITLPALRNSPIVVHIALSSAGSLSHALSLRSSAPYFLVSGTSQQAHDQSILASKLALSEKQAVIHAFSISDSSGASLISETSHHSLLSARVVPVHTHVQSSANGNALPLANGHVYANGDAGRHVRHDSLSMNLDGTPEAALYNNYTNAALSTSVFTRRALKSWVYVGPSHPEILVISLAAQNSVQSSTLPLSMITGVLSLNVFRPLPISNLRTAIPSSTKSIIVVSPNRTKNKPPTRWSPVYIDIVRAVQTLDDINPRPSVVEVDSTDPSSLPSDVRELFALTFSSPTQLPKKAFVVPKHESSYTSLLSHIFADRLELVNDPTIVGTSEDATRPEFALGRVKAKYDHQTSLRDAVKGFLDASNGVDDFTTELRTLLSKWLLAKDDGVKTRELGDKIMSVLPDSSSSSFLQRVLSLKSSFKFPSRWIVGSDAWSYDLGASGLHHLITSGLNVNILILDTHPYSTRSENPHALRKKDAGLYAMNHGDVYVASVAVYSSYGQTLQALTEADAYNGPSVVLAYLPYSSENEAALNILRETKLAVDSGYWPLYRWDPSKDIPGSEPFSLDSEAIKADLREFLDRQNHLSQLTLSSQSANIAKEFVENLGQTLHDTRAEKAKASYQYLLEALQSDSKKIWILYASDGGVAEKMAKRLGVRAGQRGIAVYAVQTMDSFTASGSPIKKMKEEATEGTIFLFITSTAGQGEPPQNGREFFKTLNAAVTAASTPFTDSNCELRFAVFGLGDSKYWPRPEDAGFYNKPGKDLDLRLEQLGAERIAVLGLGDDQGADGPQTGYKVWEPLVWSALGVDDVDIKEAEPEPVTNEHIKIASNYLRGTIKQGLEDTTTGTLAESDGQLTKFHGIYVQDDRDIRDARNEAGLEPAYAFMIRVRMPGGVCRPDQWLAMDRIADERGNGTFKLTTRQTFQFHGVIKRHLKPAIQAINKSLLDTIAACGDVNRNVLSSSNPNLSHLHQEAYETAKTISEHLLPRTSAYHEIWLDKKMVSGDAVKDFEPMYGEFYLPRKFKIAVAVPPNNDVDIFANDVGFIAIADRNGNLEGFNVCVGGGMGVTHSNTKTYPRTSDVIGFCTTNQAKHVAEKVMLVQKDNGNRTEQVAIRKNARLKYTIDRMGLDVFKADVEQRLGYQLAPARPFEFTENVDKFGWSQGFDGKNHFTMFIENGRVQDEPGKAFKTGLREIALLHKGKFRLTANQHLILADIDDQDVPLMKSLLTKHKLDNLDYSGLRLSSSACVAFPTCGLAMAESERYLPLLVDKVEAILEENGLRNDSIVMRMTGCPNGCARPYLAEIAFVGKAPGAYVMLLGGGYYGQRLNKIYRENVTEPEILAILKPMIKHYALERLEGERFGDFVIRAGYIAPTTSGKEWYDRMGGEGVYRLLDDA